MATDEEKLALVEAFWAGGAEECWECQWFIEGRTGPDCVCQVLQGEGSLDDCAGVG